MTTAIKDIVARLRQGCAEDKLPIFEELEIAISAALDAVTAEKAVPVIKLEEPAKTGAASYQSERGSRRDRKMPDPLVPSADSFAGLLGGGKEDAPHERR